MQNKIKSILFTTLLLSTSISTLTAMDPAGVSSAAHQQAQQQAQFPVISYDDLMGFVLSNMYSFPFKGNEIEAQRQFVTRGLQGEIIDFSQKMNNIGNTNKDIIKEFFTISSSDGWVRLAAGQDYNGHIAGDAGEWVKLYTLHFDKAKAIAAARASADARRATDPSASSQEELLQALPDINGFMALYFPDMVEDFSPKAMAAEQLLLTGPKAPLALPWKGKQGNWLTHPLEHELGLNTFRDVLKMFFVKNGDAFPELRGEDKKVLADGSEVVLKLGNSIGDGIPQDLVAKLRGSTAFQNIYDIQSLLQKPDYRILGGDAEVKWSIVYKQYYVDIPAYKDSGRDDDGKLVYHGFREKRLPDGRMTIISWPAFRQYISVDVVKASPSFAMLMKARELAEKVLSTAMDSDLKRDTANEHPEAFRAALETDLNKIKSLNLDELEKTYGRYDIFEWLKQKQDDIATRLEALGPVREQPQQRAQPQAQQQPQPPRQAPQAGPSQEQPRAEQTQYQESPAAQSFAERTKGMVKGSPEYMSILRSDILRAAGVDNIRGLDLALVYLVSNDVSQGYFAMKIFKNLPEDKKQAVIKVICGIEDLTALALNGMGIKTLPPEIENLASLQALYLSDNDIQSLPPEINNLRLLKDLSLAANNLGTKGDLLERFLKMPVFNQIKILDLSDNRLTSLPQYITELTNLDELSLHSNNLTTIPALKPLNPHLEWKRVAVHPMKSFLQGNSTTPGQWGKQDLIDNHYNVYVG